MELSFTHHYPAAPADVAALMRDEAFIADVAQHAGAVSHEASIGEDSTTLEMELPTPSDVASVIGTTVKMSLEMAFGAPGPEGSIPGRVDVRVPGMPVTAFADATIRPTQSGSTGDYVGEVKVRIPLVGKKVESKIQPFVLQAFRGIEARANHWLSR